MVKDSSNCMKNNGCIEQLVARLTVDRYFGLEVRILLHPQRSLKYLHGSFPERSNGADCKSVVLDFGGSNPSTPTK